MTFIYWVLQRPYPGITQPVILELPNTLKTVEITTIKHCINEIIIKYSDNQFGIFDIFILKTISFVELYGKMHVVIKRSGVHHHHNISKTVKCLTNFDIHTLKSISIRTA